MQARLTVENDDRGSLFAVSDLLWLHDQIGIPIVFDFHVSLAGFLYVPLEIEFLRCCPAVAVRADRPPLCL